MWLVAKLSASARKYAALAACATLSSACYAHVGTEPAYVESAPPAYVESGPVYYYEGRPSYYVNNRWYVRDGSRWRSYQNEPPTLYRQRVRVREAPRAYGRGRGHGYVPRRGVRVR